MDRILGHFSLRLVLNFLLAFLLVVSTGLVGYLGLQNASNTVNDLTSQIMAESATGVNQYLDSYLALPPLINGINSDSLLLGQLNLADPIALKSHFLAQMLRFEDVAAITYASEQGEYTGVARQVLGAELVFAESSARTDFSLQSYEIDSQGEQIQLLSSHPGYDPRPRPWYRAAMTKNQSTWTPIFVWSREAGIGLDAVMPVYSTNGDIQGVLDVSLYLSGISDYLKKADLAEYGSIFLVDEAGLLVASSIISEPYTAINGELKQIDLLNSNDPSLQTIGNLVEKQFTSWTSIQNNEQIVFELAGEKHLGQITPYKNGDLHWWIITVIPEAIYMSSIYNHNRSTVLFIIAWLTGSLVLMNRLSDSIIRPILQLNRAAKAFAGGQWSQRLVSDRRDEIGDLVISFNQMVENLQTSTARLQASETRLRAIYDNSSDAISVSKSGIHVTVNSAYLTIFGYKSVDDVVGRPVIDIIAPGEQARISDYIRNRSEGKSAPLIYETRGRRQDNSECDIEVRISNYELNGDIFSLAIVRDITERKVAEDALRESEERFRSIIDAAPLGIGFARQGIVFFGNPKYLEMFGYRNLEEIQGHHVIELTAPQFREDIAERIRRRSLGEPIPNEYDSMGLRKDGSQFPYSVLTSTIDFHDGLASVSFFWDISERKQAEYALRESESRFRSTFEQAAVGIAHVSPDGHFLMVNERFCDLVGYNRSELVTRTFQSITYQDDLDYDLDHLRQMLAGELDTYSIEKRYVRKDQTVQWVQLTVSLLWNDDGTPKYFISVAEDIAERKHIKEALEKSQAMLKAAFDNMQYAINIDYRGTQILANDISVKLFGYDSIEEFVNIPSLVIIAPAERNKVTFYAQQRSQGLQAPSHYETRGLKKDGSEFDMDVIVSTYEISGESYTLSAIRDITREKHLQQAEQEEREFAEALIHSAETLNQILELDVLFEKIMDLIEHVIPYDAGAIMQIKDGIMWGRAMRGFEPIVVELMNKGHFKLITGTASAQIVEKRESIAINIPRHDGRPFHEIPGFEEPHMRLGIPLIVQDAVVGFLLLIKRTPSFYTQKHIDRITAFATQVSTAYLNAILFERQRKLLEEVVEQKILLNERVKELTCLYQQSKLLEEPGIPLDTLYQETVNLLSLAWQYPDITCARLRIQGREYVTSRFQKTQWNQVAPIIVNNEQVGMLEVYYLEERREVYEGPFFQEERLLLNELARRLGHKIETLLADEALRQAHDTLEYQVIRRTAQLNSAKERVEAILNSSVDGILLVNPNFMIQQTNAAFDRLFVCDTDNYLGHPLVELFQAESDDLTIRTIQASATEREDLYIAVRAQRQDGSAFDAELGIGHIKDEGMVCIIRDITVRKQAEETLRQALAKEKELGELKTRFVSMASHEFRTPLATILAFTESLSRYRDKLTEEQIDKKLNNIRGQVNHLKDIMEDVLLLARMQARRAEFNPTRADLDALCRSVLYEFESQPDVRHRLEYSRDEIVHETVLDRKLMRQIISNLLSNAIKYSQEDQPVQVKLEATKSAYVLSVRDYGMGIPEADLKHLFEPFHRASNVGTISGTGLGLVIVRDAVELHGGTISVVSQVSVGSTFTIHIPISF